jgi:topoisomerase-4 subunit A
MSSTPAATAPEPTGATLFDALGADGTLPIHLFIERAYLSYAMSVVKGRSLPQVEDGLKPVQRRILYTMRQLGLTATSKPIKSARVVGDVLGKLHPHGDTSVYDALVRVAQDFKLRYPLIDGQGNFGSRDGDEAAAMRYTECRLTPIAELLLAEIDRGTVDFVPNYDGAFVEPSLLPARLPFLLLNGGSGPAVGYAPEIPPHNLREVVAATLLLIRKPKADLDEVLSLLPAPDFPGGGQIISPPAVIREAYATGRGSIRMRARWKREDLARGQWRIVVYELPDGVSSAKVLSEIEAATNPQPRAGKKELSQDQKNLKVLLTSVLDAARDESNKDSPVRLVLEPKTSRIAEDELMAALLAHTSLEAGVSINLVMIGRDGNPRQKGLVDTLTEWIDYRFVTVERRLRHRLDEITRRLHILEGRMLAFLRIEEVIRIIRNSDEPKAALMSKIGLSEIQAEDILEIRLRQLARLEGIRIEQEADELRAEGKGIEKLLSDRVAFTREIVKEIEADAKKYGDARRTLVETVEPVRPAEVAVADEPVTVIVSANGWVRARQGHGIDRATITYKQGDQEGAIIESRTTWPLVLLDNKGRAYSVRVSDIPGGRGDGVPLTTMLEPQDGAKLRYALSADPATLYLFSNSAGYGFIAALTDLVGRARAGKAFMTLDAGETVLPPAVVSDLKGTIGACCHGAKEARLLLFSASEMKVMPKGRGVIIMDLRDGESLTAVGMVNSDEVRVYTEGSSTPQLIKGDDMRKYQLHRARKGCQLPKKTKPTRIA